MKTRIKNKFKSAIKRGTGEAYLLIIAHPEIDFSNEIIFACIHDCSYDGQCEGSRGDYLYELISLSSQKNKIKKAVLKALANEVDDIWALCQLFDLAKKIALGGCKKARKAIYSRFFTDVIEGCDWCGTDEIVDIDGFEGLKYIAKIIGKSLENNPEDWQDGTIVESFQKDNPSIEVWKSLEKLAQSDVDIRRYLQNVIRTEENRSNYLAKKKTNKERDIIQEIKECRSLLCVARFRRKEISDSELKLIANSFLREKDLKLKEKFLRVFTELKYPFDFNPILELARKNYIPNSKLVHYAKCALSNIEAYEIRKYALYKLEHTTNPAIYTDMLKANYRDGDEKLLDRIASKFKSEELIESLACSYVDIYSHNHTPKCKEPLETLYNKMNCAIHRNDIVHLLIENGVLPERIRQEIQYDSNFATRELLN